MARAAGSILLVGATLAAASAAGQSAPRLTIDARPRVVAGGSPTTIAGRLHGGRRGSRVVLEARGFPFATGFAPVKGSRLGARGRYAFSRRPKRAARYRVVLRGRPSVRTRVASVFAEPRVLRRRCNLCGVATARPGHHTLRYRFELRYPAAAFHAEAGKRVYFYYGQRNGSGEPPRRLRLVRTVAQTPTGGDRTRVTVRHRVDLPRIYRFRFAACTRTTEAADGVGLPGGPGSHGCGAGHISLRRSRHWLG
jgi:hypothetical protein